MSTEGDTPGTPLKLHGPAEDPPSDWEPEFAVHGVP